MIYDIVVVGGGLVGASLICALKGHGLKIALIDKTVPFMTSTVDAELNSRAIALSFTSQKFFEAVDVWDQISKKSEPILEVQVSEKNHFGVTRLKAREEGLLALGHVVSADGLITVLEQTLVSVSNLTLFRPVEIHQVQFLENKWQLELSSKEKIMAKLLIAADGTDSFLRKQSGIEVVVHNYDQTALLGTIELSKSHKGIAYERFTSDGVIALLPLSKNRVKCIWVTTPERAKLLSNLDKFGFLNSCQNVFGYRAGRFVDIGNRVFYPLYSYQAESVYTHRLVLLGNAANTLHPIGAQGLNLGLRDVAALSELIVTAFRAHQDIGSMNILKAYATWRKKDQEWTRLFTHHLAERKMSCIVGILGTEFILPLKHWITRIGLGMQTELPKLSRGILL